MKRLALVAAAGALGLVLWKVQADSPSRSGRGPVVIFLVDTLRYDRMSAYGNGRPTSPAADRLAREGVRYDSAYSVASWTRPAVASLFTSRWPSEVGSVGRWGSLSRKARSIARLFLSRGWETAAFCGQPNIYARELGFRAGFGYFASIHPGGPGVDEGVSTADRVVEPALQWIEERQDPRFFLFVHVVDPHNGGIDRNPNPYRHWVPGYENLFSKPGPPELDRREWRLSKYDALVRQSDDQFARLRRELEKKKFWSSALVAYVADHGEEFWEHGGLYHGQSLFEELVHIPMIVKAPGWRSAGEVEKRSTSILDVLPSIADWAGLPADPTWRGEVIDRERPNPSRVVYFSEELDAWRLYGMRRGRTKVIASLTPPFRAQFDLVRDPGEQNPVPGDAESARILEGYRRAEMASYGGLWIRKTGRGSAAIRGVVDLVDSMPPYFLLSDREKYPVNPRNPAELPIDTAVTSDQTLDIHIDSLDGRPALTPRLTVTAGDRSVRLPAGFTGRLGSIEITNAWSTELSPDQMSEVTRSMRALGYLGGGAE